MLDTTETTMGDGMVEQQWVWERTADGSARFVLGTVGLNPLVCFGINPSTAVPNSLDRTVARVSRFAADNGYDSWTMLNVYPQISTDPKGMDQEHCPELRAENERQIMNAIGDRPRTLLAAWGGLVESRAYLPTLLRGIVRVASDAGCDWMSLGQPTKFGHPRHPLYVRGDTPFQEFNADKYLQTSF
jgi:hypothetical protein